MKRILLFLSFLVIAGTADAAFRSRGGWDPMVHARLYETLAPVVSDVPELLEVIIDVVRHNEPIPVDKHAEYIDRIVTIFQIHGYTDHNALVELRHGVVTAVMRAFARPVEDYEVRYNNVLAIFGYRV